MIDIGAGDSILKVALPEESALSYGVGSAMEIDLPPADAYLFFRETGIAIR